MVDVLVLIGFEEPAEPIFEHRTDVILPSNMDVPRWLCTDERGGIIMLWATALLHMPTHEEKTRINWRARVFLQSLMLEQIPSYPTNQQFLEMLLDASEFACSRARQLQKASRDAIIAAHAVQDNYWHLVGKRHVGGSRSPAGANTMH